MNKAEFLQKYTPGNYTDEEFPDLARDFKRDLDDYVQQVSRENDFKKWIKELIELNSNLKFLIDGYQTGEIFEWHDWWFKGLTPNEALIENYNLYG